MVNRVMTLKLILRKVYRSYVIVWCLVISVLWLLKSWNGNGLMLFGTPLWLVLLCLIGGYGRSGMIRWGLYDAVWEVVYF